MKLSDEDKVSATRQLARTDLYFLLRYVLKRADVEKPWLFERCKEVEREPNDQLDLWAREHYKSTIITYAKTLQDILASHGDDPLPEWGGEEVTVGIFSHSRPIAKAFLLQIKRECEENQYLKDLFPDVVWDNPKGQAPKWSEDDGLIFKRRTNPKEATVEAWGVVDGQPTGKHFKILVYDDVVTKESVNTPEQIAKTTDSLALSYNLGAHGGFRRFIGTRYHFNDTYRELLKRGTAKPRIYAATADGTVNGEPVFLDRETLKKKRWDMGPYVFGCQMLQDPKADETQGFNIQWLRYYGAEPKPLGNRYILCDPANEKRKENDYTSWWVIDCRADMNYWVLDMIRDRQSLTERANTLFHLHRKWGPIDGVGYEKYGLQSDIQHFEDRMEREGYSFDITPLGGATGKNDRIKRLIPIFEQGRMRLPMHCYRTDYEGVARDMVKIFVDEEYEPFPVGIHPDMLDGLARITDEDLGVIWPEPIRSVDPRVPSGGARKKRVVAAKKRSWRRV